MFIVSHLVVFGIGTFSGVAIMCLMQVSKEADERMEQITREKKEQVQ